MERLGKRGHPTAEEYIGAEGREAQAGRSGSAQKQVEAVSCCLFLPPSGSPELCLPDGPPRAGLEIGGERVGLNPAEYYLLLHPFWGCMESPVP